MKCFLNMAVLIIMAVIPVSCGDPNVENMAERANKATTDQCKLKGNTPDWTSYKAVSQPSSAVMAAIDRGWARNELIAKHYGYKVRTTRDNYLMLIVPEQTKSYGGVPSIALAISCKFGGGYCFNADYDKGPMKLNDDYLFDPNGRVKSEYLHYMTVAENVLPETLEKKDGSGNYAPIQCTIISPKEETVENLKATENVVVYCFEHGALFHNNRQLYEQTIGVGRDLHPLLPVP